MDRKTKQEITKVLKNQGRHDLVVHITSETQIPKDVDRYLRSAQGILGDARKNLGRDDRKVWIGISAAIQQLMMVVHYLDPDLAQKLDDLGVEVMMRGR